MTKRFTFSLNSLPSRFKSSQQGTIKIPAPYKNLFYLVINSDIFNSEILNLKVCDYDSHHVFKTRS